MKGYPIKRRQFVAAASALLLTSTILPSIAAASADKDGSVNRFIYNALLYREPIEERQDGDIFRHYEIVEHMPACLIHDEDGVRIPIDVAGNFGQMRRHRIDIAPRHDESCRLAELWADCAEDIGRSRALIMRR